jgi:hypothetical protein
MPPPAEYQFFSLDHQASEGQFRAVGALSVHPDGGVNPTKAEGVAFAHAAGGLAIVKLLHPAIPRFNASLILRVTDAAMVLRLEFDI